MADNKNMRKRSVVILNRFLGKTEKVYSIQALAKEFEVSVKTIRNDINDINGFFAKNKLPELNIDENHIVRIDRNSDIKKIHQALDNLNLYAYRLSSEERIIYIMTTLLMQNSYITMQRLADELRVTRITTINDFDIIKEQLAYYQIELISSAKKGVLLRGEYLNKIRMLVDLYFTYNLMDDSPRFFQKLIHHQLNAIYAYDVILRNIKSIIQKNDVVFLGNALSRLTALLYVILNIPNKQEIEHNETTKLDFLLDDLCQALQIDVNQSTRYAYQMYLEEFHLKDLLKSTNYIELYEIVRYFLIEVGKDIGYEVENDDLLIESLVLHIKSANETIEIVLPIKDDIHLPVNVTDVKQSCDKHIHILEKLLEYRFEDNVKNAIILHICASLVREFTQVRKLRVMIICASGMATGKYLEAQIKNYFDFDIVGVSSAKKITPSLIYKLSPDFIISSIPLDIKGETCIQVSAKLTMDDLNTIQATTFQFEKNAIKIINQKKTLIKRAESLFNSLEDDTQLLAFSAEFEKMVEKYEQLIPINGKVHIHQNLKPKYIQKTNDELDWQTAIRLAEKPLLDYGYISNEYIEKSIQNVIEYGDYIVVSPCVALAHAGSNDGVFKDGLSLLVSEKPVYLPNNSCVHLIFAFSSTGIKDYAELLKEIVALGKNKKNIDQIISSKNTIDIFYKLIK